MKFIGERKRDFEEEVVERDRSGHSRARHENIFSAIQEEDDESRYGDGLPAAKSQQPNKQAVATRTDMQVQRAQSTSRSRASKRDGRSAEQRRADSPAGVRRHPETGEGPARGASDGELPQIRARLPVSGKSKATSSKSRKRKTLDPNGFEKWFKKSKHSNMYARLTQHRARPGRG